MIPAVRKAVGKSTQIHIDTGIMDGADVIAAMAKGANFTWVGRAYLYGLMAGGGRGVSRTFEILETQMVRTMKLLGVQSVSELDPSMVKYLKERLEG
jgi:isopentenyl diphosphate isomerase/L-lactate dehydrogenase-like FMN-dependent dehydrogenase